MLHITSLRDGLELFKALGSDIRIQILETLINQGPMNMNQLANQLDITSGTLTSHVKKLEECGLIYISNESASHGNQKICSIAQYKILLDYEKEKINLNEYETSVRIGHFKNHSISPTCGLATKRSVIGILDDPRFFNHPDRFDADILWFTEGFLEYSIPNLIPADMKIDILAFSMELSSEAPGINETWPSDISFYVNDTYVGTWTSPGDFGDVRGNLTPTWWPMELNQYGLLKILTIGPDGTFIDGLKLSDIRSTDLQLDFTSNITFKLAIEPESENIGGITLFGKCFGNYEQDIKVNIIYSPLNESK